MNEPDRFRPAPELAEADSPLYLLAVLASARRSQDRTLERVTRRRLESQGIAISFGDDLQPDPKTGGRRDAR